MVLNLPEPEGLGAGAAAVVCEAPVIVARCRRPRDGQRHGRPAMVGEGGTNSRVDCTHSQ